MKIDTHSNLTSAIAALMIGFVWLSSFRVSANAADVQDVSVDRVSTNPISVGVDGFKAHIAPFFKTHCVKCHGPNKSKGKITLHSLDGDLSAGQELERWESILDVLTHGEMPPEDEPQPKEDERQAVAKWIESGLRDYVEHASKEAPKATARRLTKSRVSERWWPDGRWLMETWRNTFMKGCDLLLSCDHLASRSRDGF